MKIFRAIAGVIVGYLTTAILVIVSFMALYFIAPLDFTFQAGNWDPSMGWIAVSIVLGLVAAVLGGLVCALIAVRGSKAPLVFLVLVLIAGGLQAVRTRVADEPLERSPEATKVEGIQTLQSHPRQPRWVMVLNPIIAAAGIFLGAKLRGGRKEEPTPLED